MSKDAANQYKNKVVENLKGVFNNSFNRYLIDPAKLDSIPDFPIKFQELYREIDDASVNFQAASIGGNPRVIQEEENKLQYLQAIGAGRDLLFSGLRDLANKHPQFFEEIDKSKLNSLKLTPNERYILIKDNKDRLQKVLKVVDKDIVNLIIQNEQIVDSVLRKETREEAMKSYMKNWAIDQYMNQIVNARVSDVNIDGNDGGIGGKLPITDKNYLAEIREEATKVFDKLPLKEQMNFINKMTNLQKGGIGNAKNIQEQAAKFFHNNNDSKGLQSKTNGMFKLVMNHSIGEEILKDLNPKNNSKAFSNDKKLKEHISNIVTKAIDKNPDVDVVALKNAIRQEFASNLKKKVFSSSKTIPTTVLNKMTNKIIEAVPEAKIVDELPPIPSLNLKGKKPLPSIPVMEDKKKTMNGNQAKEILQNSVSRGSLKETNLEDSKLNTNLRKSVKPNNSDKSKSIN
ncbi:MAG: hypothetical protein J0H68_03245 [Sphingobacteriia bacterium]|nr:hypothetical protein [Sphingobacteriia bacterium]